VTSARLYAKTNGPGCPELSKPTITRVKLSKESLDQFMTFLLDKNNTTPSSYKVNAGTGLPVMYLNIICKYGCLCIIYHIHILHQVYM
jgi:hypothetical protein